MSRRLTRRRQVIREVGTCEFHFADNLETEPGNSNGFSVFVTLSERELPKRSKDRAALG